MNRDLQRLRQDLEQPRPANHEPFDRYAYNAFAWQAAYWTIHGRTEEERQEAVRLRSIACQKSREMQTDIPPAHKQRDTKLLDWLYGACEHEQDTEARREFGLMLGYAMAGQMSRRVCETARDSHFSRGHAWQQVLRFMSQPIQEPARELVEVAP